MTALKALLARFWRRAPKRNMPVPGERWAFTPRPLGPWPMRESDMVATIRDVANGWVRYSLGRVFDDERMRADHFVQMYRRLER